MAWRELVNGLSKEGKQLVWQRKSLLYTLKHHAHVKFYPPELTDYGQDGYNNQAIYKLATHKTDASPRGFVIGSHGHLETRRKKVVHTNMIEVRCLLCKDMFITKRRLQPSRICETCNATRTSDEIKQAYRERFQFLREQHWAKVHHDIEWRKTALPYNPNLRIKSWNRKRIV